MPADRITVTRQGLHASVVVDGVEIPGAAIRRDSVVVPVDPDEIPTVTLTLMARNAQATNTSEGDTPHGTAR
ncbi:hypothetical protein [Nocardiopsis synnemataformans]|uniref:hypothetical protein n=1 Tax=Nocardiopsis synnemataformans TaxID=61305 RepID=UPI003EBFBE8C